MPPFRVVSDFEPAGDQPEAIAALARGVESGERFQTLLGITGSGKSATVAWLIEKIQRPTLVLAPNKALAAQLANEFRQFFPENRVEYFVSYYDYYQPEAYIPSSDTYIEKEATINDEIDKLRLATTTNLLTRPDVIVVASVSCIYNLGSPVEYGRYLMELIEGELISREALLLNLSNLQYERSDDDLRRGTYRLRGDVIQLWPAYEDTALRLDTLENKIVSIDRIDPVTGSKIAEPATTTDPNQPSRAKRYVLYPAKHYVVNPKTQAESLGEIRHDLQTRVAQLKAQNRVVEAYRLEQKVNYDLEMIQEFGFVNGIENYSRHFDGRKPGDPPFTLLDYFWENVRLFDTDSFLTIIDESHITVPQVRGMHNGDRARKETLIEYGFRLPSALDNRPLQFHEFQAKTNQVVYVSATPNDWEISQAGGEVVEQLIRPTGLIDPPVELRPITGQIEDLIVEIMKRKQHGQRVLVTTLTKRMAEALTEYLNDADKVRELIAQAVTKQQELDAQPNPDRTLFTGDLPVESMPIDKIDPTYHTAAVPTSDLNEAELPKVAYLHSDVETLERSDILADLRRGVYDVVVGINLLREGLDLPEVTLVAILDADKEGFLRSTTSLIQTMGRAARHVDGQVIMYADRLTGSMKLAIAETYRRRSIQISYNQQHGITPQTISKPIRDRMIEKPPEDEAAKLAKLSQKERSALVLNLSKHEQIDLAEISTDTLTPAEVTQLVPKLRRRMKQAANDMDFELAALIRDKIQELDGV